MDKTVSDKEESLVDLKEETGAHIDPSTTNKRFYMLFLACLLCIGSYFAYNNPAALETQIEEVTCYVANESIICWI